MLRVILTTILAILALLVMSTVAAPVALGDDQPVLLLPEPAAARSLDEATAADSAEWVELPVVPAIDEPLPAFVSASSNFAASSDNAVSFKAIETEVLPTVDLPSGELPTGNLPTAATICSERHWILSIRHCSRDCPECACRFEFGVHKADWNGNWEPSSMAEFQQSMLPGIPICVMIHGSFVTEETVAHDSCQTFRWLRQAAPERPLQVVFISWPSDGIFTLDPAVAASSLFPTVDVGILGRRAELNGCRIARLVQSFPPESPICLLGHSHGARMVSSAMHFLGGGELHGIRVCDGPSHRVRGILAAAAIDHDWLAPGQRYDRALCGAECVLNLQSKFDWALSIYPLRRPFSRRALGQAGFTSKDRRLLGARSQQVANFDVSDSLGVGHIWPCYYERPEIAAAIAPWIYFTE